MNVQKTFEVFLKKIPKKDQFFAQQVELTFNPFWFTFTYMYANGYNDSLAHSNKGTPRIS